MLNCIVLYNNTCMQHQMTTSVIISPKCAIAKVFLSLLTFCWPSLQFLHVTLTPQCKWIRPLFNLRNLSHQLPLTERLKLSWLIAHLLHSGQPPTSHWPPTYFTLTTQAPTYFTLTTHLLHTDNPSTSHRPPTYFILTSDHPPTSHWPVILFTLISRAIHDQLSLLWPSLSVILFFGCNLLQDNNNHLWLLWM